MVDHDVDVLIIGGGLTGALLLLALDNAGYSTLLVDAKPINMNTQSDFDARSLAISPASMRIFKILKVWPELASFTTAINTIHVSEQKRFGLAHLKSKKNEPLGYVVEMQHLTRVLHALLPQKKLLAPAELSALDPSQKRANFKKASGETITVKANLIVAADGAESQVRKLTELPAHIKDYKQCAVVANIGLSRPHNFCAYERFTVSGPLALLPMSDNRSSLVWSLPPNVAKKMMAMSEQEFIKSLQKVFGYRLGRFSKIGRRALFPLQQVTMKQQTSGSIVFIGNAAHTLHPVAGQGFNLGLRDVALLAQCIIREGIEPGMLDKYQKMRQYDQNAITHFTNGLVELFTTKMPGLATARGLGLIALDNLPPVKRLLSRYAGGFAGIVPDLVCQIPLLDEDSL